MLKRLVSIVSLLACVACVGLIPAASASAKAVRPALCERSCGGAWGAYEHAQSYAERYDGEEKGPIVTSCVNQGTNKSGVTQWICSGHDNEGFKFRLGLDPYGYLTFWEIH